jgi:FkbM family methyltransferase
MHTLRKRLGLTPLGPPYRRVRRTLRRRTPIEKINAAYDRDLIRVMQLVLAPGSTCIDVGAHRGDVLAHMTRIAPDGQHVAIEPLPEFAAILRERFSAATVYECAVSDHSDHETFHRIVGAEAYSRLRVRDTGGLGEPNALAVLVQRLDDLPAARRNPVCLIKIDVEGGEVAALRGAADLLRENQPFVAIEHGGPTAELYGDTTDALYDLLIGAGLRVSTLRRWLDAQPAFDRRGFLDHAKAGWWFFLAYPG